MEKSTRIVAQVYGYAICLVAVITFLISTTGLVTAISLMLFTTYWKWMQWNSKLLPVT
jgi:hypothetical protein